MLIATTAPMKTCKEKSCKENKNCSSAVVCGRFDIKTVSRLIGIVDNTRNILLFFFGHILLFTVWCGNDPSIQCDCARATIVWALSVEGVLVFVTIIAFLLLLLGLRSEDPVFVKLYPVVHVLWIIYFFSTSIAYMKFGYHFLEIYVLGVCSLISFPFQIMFLFVTLKCYLYLNRKSSSSDDHANCRHTCSITEEEMCNIASGP